LEDKARCARIAIVDRLVRLVLERQERRARLV
jgi:hypothetical protein